ncbi:DeoR/GlpR family DNA-binding transcription regulator [uncultured Succinatimonas sp.]|uniref:DeoR/GlpR family DNA-binding transcription regulator n=1 Tax=uncultured Succinatimonas sp. TaxID=1262973 RepID=UPI0025FDEA7B|nr:DeoR/GlpR family DNA-binding transcription regulator [uncultured Succinatimonas sp.]
MGQGRAKQIVEYLKLHNLVTVDELVSLTGASPATIRRELTRLDKEGAVYRVHGGVTLSRFVPSQPTTSEKQGKHHKEKLRIAAKASNLVKPGDSIVLDAGTTTIEIARNLINMPLRVITNDLHIGLMLAEYQQMEVSVTGGTVDWSSQSCVGDVAVNFLSKVHPTYTFISCNAFKVDTGITAPTSDKAAVKRIMTQQSSKRVLVADSSKYGLTQLFEVGPLTSVDMIITDDGLDEKAADEIKKQGIELILC